MKLQETGDGEGKKGRIKGCNFSRWDNKTEFAFLPEIKDTDYGRGCALSTDYSAWDNFSISESQHTCSFSYSFLMCQYSYIAEFSDSRQRNFMLLGQCRNSLTVMMIVMVIKLNSAFIYVVTQQSKGRLWNKYEQRDKQNKHILVYTNKNKTR